MSEITELITQENDELEDYEVDQSVICNTKYLHHISRLYYEPEKPEPPKQTNDHPFPYIFYPNTEDVNIKTRYSILRGLPSGIPVECSWKCPEECLIPKPVDPYCEDDAEEQYLSSNPISFLILSKPDVGEKELAKILSENCKCVCITPDIVIREEIESGTRAGKCINYNLQSGRAIGPEIILRLVERRVKSQTAEHRGFVISGFPLISNNLYKEDPLSSESAIFNVEEIFEEILLLEGAVDRPDTASTIKGSKVSLDVDKSISEVAEEEKAEEEETEDKKKVKEVPKKFADIDLGSERENIVRHTSSFAALSSAEEQMNFLFALFKKPMVVIYILCGNLDVVNKRDDYRFNIIHEQEISLRKEPDTVFLPGLSENHHHEEDEIDGNELKNLVKLPVHLNTSISAQLIQFKYNLHPIIEERILQHDPQYFIKVDGRLSPFKMFTAVRLRLKSLGFQTVLIPEKLIEDEIEGEFSEEATVKLTDNSPETVFHKLQSRHVVNPMFKWQLSHWGYKCPVAFKEGKVMKGLGDHAVRFMNKIFFLSGEDAFLKFYRNPRRYLIPIKPQPSCRIFIMGPKFSGRTAVSQCLSYLFNCTLLDPIVLEEQYRKKKEWDYLEKVRTAAITQGLVALKEMREEERKVNIENWVEKANMLFEEAYPELKPEKKIKSVVFHGNTSSESIKSNKTESKVHVKNVSDISIDLERMNLPNFSNMTLITELHEDNSKLMYYLPEEYKKPIEPATVFDPFVTQYVEDEVKNAMLDDTSLNVEEIVDMFRTAIMTVESQNPNHKGGWVIDGIPPEMSLLKEFTPDIIADDIICLRDIDPENEFLLAKFTSKDISQFREYRNFFNNLRRISAARRAPTYQVTRASNIAFVEKIIEEMEQNAVSEIDGTADIELVLNQKSRAYAEHLKDFNEKWNEVKEYFSNICCDPPIEVNIANKGIPHLLKDCVLRIEGKYKLLASVFTEEDRAQEELDFGGGGGNTGEEEEEFDEEGPVTNDFFQENRRLGNTSDYCPVSFYRYFVLWKGKEEYAVQFEKKIYLMCNEHARNEFVEEPNKFLVCEPPTIYPPSRICFIGPTGSGKSTLAKTLAENFGLFYVNFDQIVLEYFDLIITTKFEEIIRMDSSHSEVEIHANEIDIIRSYLVSDAPFPENILKHVLYPLWFHEPYKSIGFILDNFPRKASDVNFMVNSYMIPDAVIELHVNQSQIHERVFEPLIIEWQHDIDEKKRIKDAENEIVLENWRKNREEKMKDLAELVKQERKHEAFENQPPIPPFSTPVDSSISLAQIREEDEEIELKMFIYDPEQEQEDMDEIKLKIEEELPEPDFNYVWESREEATERIETLLGEIYSREIVFLDELRQLLLAEHIESMSFETNKTADKIFLEVTRATEKFKFRNDSFFERVYSITIDVAEKLLELGYYFMSKFGRTCPVQVYEKKNPVQMYLSLEHRMTIYPMIHRKYIYFICGEIHRLKFKQNPLLYTQNQDYELPLLPMKLAIIGPPKSGKSTLAERFQREFGLKIITRGHACRYVLKVLNFCELARNMKIVLDKGWSLTPEMVAGAVEALTLDGRSISQGFVLDGYPTCVEEIKHLRNLGIVPYLYLHISADLNKLHECTLNDTGKKDIAPYSFKFIKFRYDEWKKEWRRLIKWLNREYENVYTIPTPDTKWHMWTQARDVTAASVFEILDYFKRRKQNVVFRLMCLVVSPFEFDQKQSSFLTFCPCCWYFNSYLVSGGKYPKRSGLTQFNEFYYWLCAEHIHMFIENPVMYIPPVSIKLLPKDLPEQIDGICEEPYQDGLCIVSFWDNQPNRVLKQGSWEYSVLHKELCYIFCSEECLKKFMKEPHVYYDRVIHFRDLNPLELCKNIPTLGYLEQFTANILIRAILNTEIMRPLHPCMDPAMSAAMNIGFFLKIFNPKTRPDFVTLYQESRRKFDARRDELKELIVFFKSTTNPFLCLDDLPASYEICRWKKRVVKQTTPSEIKDTESTFEAVHFPPEGVNNDSANAKGDSK